MYERLSNTVFRLRGRTTSALRVLVTIVFGGVRVEASISIRIRRERREEVPQIVYSRAEQVET